MDVFTEISGGQSLLWFALGFALGWAICALVFGKSKFIPVIVVVFGAGNLHGQVVNNVPNASIVYAWWGDLAGNKNLEDDDEGPWSAAANPSGHTGSLVISLIDFGDYWMGSTPVWREWELQTGGVGGNQNAGQQQATIWLYVPKHGDYVEIGNSAVGSWNVYVSRGTYPPTYHWSSSERVEYSPALTSAQQGGGVGWAIGNVTVNAAIMMEFVGTTQPTTNPTSNPAPTTGPAEWVGDVAEGLAGVSEDDPGIFERARLQGQDGDFLPDSGFSEGSDNLLEQLPFSEKSDSVEDVGDDFLILGNEFVDNFTEDIQDVEGPGSQVWTLIGGWPGFFSRLSVQWEGIKDKWSVVFTMIKVVGTGVFIWTIMLVLLDGFFWAVGIDDRGWLHFLSFNFLGEPEDGTQVWVDYVESEQYLADLDAEDAIEGEPLEMDVPSRRKAVGVKAMDGDEYE